MQYNAIQRHRQRLDEKRQVKNNRRRESEREGRERETNGERTHIVQYHIIFHISYHFIQSREEQSVDETISRVES